MDEMEEVIGEFLVESFENLDRMDTDLLALEQDEDTETVASIFRSIHTIKGTCGFLGFERLERVAHVGETLLGKLRDGELQVTGDIASALLSTTDAIRAMLTAIEATGADGEADHDELVAMLTRLAESDPGPAQAAAQGPRLGELLVAAGDADADAVETAAAQQARGDGRPIGEVLIDHNAVAPEAVHEALERQQSPRGGIADSSIRVDVGLLDDLMNLVGELVLARNQIVQLTAATQEGELVGASQRLNLITTELQEGVMKTRMQPIGTVWNKFPRVVRDLAVACGKQVHLDMDGQDTELDKTIIEAIKDPLTHLVRNAVDHGIEPPEDRQRAGKPEQGTLTLRAFHESGRVNIEIADDGGGIDAGRIKAKAVERGLITLDEAARMGEREALNLIFAPGFSTAEQITNVSGRGVGMDVVRTNIEKIGGTVDVSTELGRGTSFRVKIPLTLAIIPALVVASGEDRYAIPQLNLLELVRLEGEQARRGIERIHGAPVYRLRGRLLPIVDLSAQLGRHTDASGGRDVINIVVLHADGQHFGLVVDDIHDSEEIVVKPLGSHLKEATLFAGATIMGDGRVALILDVLGMAQRAHVLSETRERSGGGGELEAGDGDVQRRTLLLVGVGEDRRAAIALSDVSRLEEFPADAVEWASGREVVQYRGEILPLVRLGDALGIAAYGSASEPLNVVVHTHEDRNVGVVVQQILDIVEQEVVLEAGDGRPGLLGSAVLQGRVTDVLDVNDVVAATDPSRFGADPYAGV